MDFSTIQIYLNFVVFGCNEFFDGMAGTGFSFIDSRDMQKLASDLLKIIVFCGFITLPSKLCVLH